MLERIDLRHFKCFESLKLPLRRLTLLSGANASGKSSVMQALVLLHQTMREHEWSSRLMLNGATVRLGAVADVIDQVHGRRACEIALLNETGYYRWEFSGERNEMSMAVKRVSVSHVGGFQEGEPEMLHYLLPAKGHHHLLTEPLCRLTYLTAERLGPRETYLLEAPELALVVGPRGEHTASILHLHGHKKVLKELVTKDVTPTRLRQVEARMKRFFPGCELVIDQIPQASVMTLGLRTSSATEFHRPIHTGFGLTQILPIVVAALSASQDDLLLIENPEVHLHPAGQSAMGQFLSEVAAAGVQVILETHSDHVLNGIRRAIKNKILLPNAAVLHFFRPRREDERDERPQVESPNLDANGNIDSWPDGFFDQFDKDMNYFAGWS